MRSSGWLTSSKPLAKRSRLCQGTSMSGRCRSSKGNSLDTLIVPTPDATDGSLAHSVRIVEEWLNDRFVAYLDREVAKWQRWNLGLGGDAQAGRASDRDGVDRFGGAGLRPTL